MNKHSLGLVEIDSWNQDFHSPLFPPPTSTLPVLPSLLTLRRPDLSSVGKMSETGLNSEVSRTVGRRFHEVRWGFYRDGVPVDFYVVLPLLH